MLDFDLSERREVRASIAGCEALRDTREQSGGYSDGIHKGEK